MPGKRHSPEQILGKLREVEVALGERLQREFQREAKG